MNRVLLGTFLGLLIPTLGGILFYLQIISLIIWIITTLICIIILIISFILYELSQRRGWLGMGARAQLAKTRLTKKFSRKASVQFKKSLNSKAEQEYKADVASLKSIIEATKEVKASKKALKYATKLENLIK